MNCSAAICPPALPFYQVYVLCAYALCLVAMMAFVLSNHWPLRHVRPQPALLKEESVPQRRALCPKCREQHVFRLEQSTVRAQPE